MTRKKFCEIDEYVYDMLVLRAKTYKKMSEEKFLSLTYSDSEFFVYYFSYIANYYFKKCFEFNCFLREMFYENLISYFVVAKNKYNPSINKKFSTYLYWYFKKAYHDTKKYSMKTNCAYIRLKRSKKYEENIKV